MGQKSISFSISYIPRITICIVLFFALLLLLEVHNFVSQTKTIVGHNLEPTPWHIFPTKSNESKYSKASKIIQCNYLTCATTSSTKNNLPLLRKSKDKIVQCPSFFKHIHNDLKPWAKSKISISHLMEAQKYAAFRVAIIGGKLYVDFYYKCVQSRAMFTIWGFLQLLRKYPGIIADVDLMFDCMDKPSINRTENLSMPLPLFRYCTTNQHFDIPFPDWSFWGWPETDIRAWDDEFPSIREGSKLRSWKRKWPLAYWRGNPNVSSPIRMELINCNDTRKWRTQILIQDWEKAEKGGFTESKLSKQCDYRYNIYAEGYAWSVSLKYILSCGCVPLIISTQYEDFFTRGLIPHKNYLLIPTFGMCEAIKSAVDWGNTHLSEAEAIGKAAQDFMGSFSMDRVYDYMYHLITEYSKLQNFKPVRPPTAQEVCEESVHCFAEEKQKQFLESSITFSSLTPPCSIQS